MNMPLLGAAAVVVGAVLGEWLGPGSGRTMYLLAAVVGALLVARRQRDRTRSGSPARRRARAVRRIAMGVVLAALGAAAMQRALDGTVHHPLQAATMQRSPVVIAGTLAGDPREAFHVTTALLRVDSWRLDRPGTRATPANRTVLVRVGSREASLLRVARAGDSVRVAGDLAPLSRFEQSARTRHAVARLDIVRVEAIDAARAPWWWCANAFRSLVERGTRSLPPDTQALVLGFVLGDTRAIPQSTVDTFRAAGLTHLLAVSGANVAFVLTLAGPLLRRLPVVPRAIGAAGIVAVFALATRLEPSVLRAAAMAGVVAGARLVGRGVDPRRVLGLAVGTLLLADPFLLHAPGFWLSVGACCGIVLTAARIERRLPGPGWLRRLLGVTIAAQLGVLPVLVGVFGTVAWVAPAANLFAVPAAEPITVLAIPAAVAAALWAPLGPVLLAPVRWLLTWVVVVAGASAARPLAVAVAAALVVAASTVVPALLGGRNPPVESPR